MSDFSLSGIAHSIEASIRGASTAMPHRTPRSAWARLRDEASDLLWGSVQRLRRGGAGDGAASSISLEPGDIIPVSRGAKALELKFLGDLDRSQAVDLMGVTHTPKFDLYVREGLRGLRREPDLVEYFLDTKRPANPPPRRDDES